MGDHSDALGGNGSLEKSLVHGVTQAGVAKLSGGDAKAAFTAGMTTELLSGWMGDQFKDTTGTAEGLANEKDKQAKLARVLGSLAGAIATNTAEGANSGATTGETIDRYNRQLHPDEQDALDKLADGDKEKKRRLLAAACYLVNCAKGLPLTATDAQIATAQALQSEGAQYAAEQGQLKAYVGDYKVDPLLNIASRPQNLFNYSESDGLDDYRSDGYNSGIRATTAKFNDAYDADFSPQGFDYSLKGLEFLTSMGVGLYWKNAIGLDARAATTAEKGMLDLLDESSTVYRPSVKKLYIEEPAFNPTGSVGAAKNWSTKARVNYVELPNQGKIRYIPPENYSPSMPLPRGPNNGYLDKFGNEWTKGPSRTQGQTFEWDVQLSKTGKSQLGWATRDGSHLNVSLDGRITHK